jgi:hypothetical protein
LLYEQGRKVVPGGCVTLGSAQPTPEDYQRMVRPEKADGLPMVLNWSDTELIPLAQSSDEKHPDLRSGPVCSQNRGWS